MTYDVKLPILGFESMTRLELTQIDDFFVSVRNLDDDVPTFTLISPYALREYSFDLPNAVQELLGVTPESKLLVYTMVVLQNPIERSTVNFLAPIIFNTDNGAMGQVVLDSTRYSDLGLAEPIGKYLQK